jgi:hypothetical protein
VLGDILCAHTELPHLWPSSFSWFSLRARNPTSIAAEAVPYMQTTLVALTDAAPGS